MKDNDDKPKTILVRNSKILQKNWLNQHQFKPPQNQITEPIEQVITT